jgi:hypothetical protein
MMADLIDWLVTTFGIGVFVLVPVIAYFVLAYPGGDDD